MKVQSILVISIISIILMGSTASAGWFTDLFKLGSIDGKIIQNDIPSNQPDFILLGKHTDKKMDQLLSSSGPISLKDIGNIYGLSVSANINFASDNGLVRFILVSKDKEYLVYEAYPRIANKGTVVINNACEETCALERTSADVLKVQIIDAAVDIRSISYISDYKNLNNDIKNRITTSNKELKKRQDAYKIKKIKEKKLAWLPGETTVSQMTYQEKKQLFRDPKNNGHLPNLQGFEYYKGGIFELDAGNPGATAEPQEAPSTSTGTLPPDWDWRNRHNQSWVTPVKNQGQCGSCWAFGATGATETMVNLYFNQHINMNLAEQDVLSCSNAGSCAGGYHTTAASYIQNTGVVNEECFIYQASDLSCENKCISPNEKVQIGGRTASFYSSHGEDALKEMIINGAVSGRVDSWWHVMHLVGYGTIKEDDLIYYGSYTQRKTIQPGDPLIGQTYWTFKNSWGTGWGEAGYCRINLPLSEFGGSFAVTGPITTLNDYEIACVDQDNDTFCNWGISANKPSSCPSQCSAEPDCDDSDPNIGTFDSDHNCINVNTCQDSDGGINYETAGQLYDPVTKTQKSDYCLDDLTLREAYCQNNAGTYQDYQCPFLCRDGACVTPTCSDSDGGKEYYVKGTITGYMAFDEPNYDRCNGTILQEVYCYENLGYTESYTCQGICIDGACMDITPPSIAITYPGDDNRITDKFLTVTTETSENTVLVDFYVDDSFKSSDTKKPFTFRFNTQPYYGTQIHIKAIARADNELPAEDTVTVFIGNEPETPKLECSDGKDNDGDKKCDLDGCAKNKAIWYPGDPECTSEYDTSESS